MTSSPKRQLVDDSTGELDAIWASSRTARQIYALGEVEKDISRLLSLAASTMSLLALPQTDESGTNLPQGDERSEQFVVEVTEYFDRLDSIQDAIRGSLAHIRQSRIAPSAINAPLPSFIPPALGVGLPKHETGQADDIANVDDTDKREHVKLRGLQEERVERDAWRGILEALVRLRGACDFEDKEMGPLQK